MKIKSILIVGLLPTLGFSQTLQNLKVANHDVIVNNQPMSFNEAAQFCRSNNYYLASERGVKIVVGNPGANISSNTFWTSKEVYMSNKNVDHLNKTIDYDAANVYYRAQNVFNPEDKSSSHPVICSKEIQSDLQSAKSNLVNAFPLGAIKVYPQSISSMSLDQAKAFCQGLGDGWRLPTVDELQQIKLSNRISITDLSQPIYWSGTKSCDGCYTSYFAIQMETGAKTSFETNSNLRFIPVFSATTQNNTFSTWNFGAYEVTTQFFGPMTIAEAMNFCMKSTENPNKPWRVTSMQELSSMKSYKSEIPGMIGKRFFSYENRSQTFNRQDLNVVKIEPLGTNETWISGSEESRCYFFMSRRK